MFEEFIKFGIRNAELFASPDKVELALAFKGVGLLKFLSIPLHCRVQ